MLSKATSKLVAVGAAIVLLWMLMIVLTVSLIGSGGLCSAPTAGQPAASGDARDIPANYLAIYQKTGRDYAIPWNVLAAIGKVESDHGRDPGSGVRHGANWAGAAGPMQIGIGGAAGTSWQRRGVDGNGDGHKDVYDPADAIPTAARILIEDKGYRSDARTAVRRYNGSGPQAEAYATKVMALAQRYAAGNFTVGGPNGGSADASLTGADCPDGTGLTAGGPTGQRIVQAAMRWLRTPYKWGAGNWDGPTGYACSYGKCGKAFDCSGLTMYAVAQATGGKIKIAHFTGSQFNDPHGKHVSFGQLQPGDLMFFTHPTDDVSHHVSIYIGGGKMIHAPHTGDWVRISTISGTYRSEFSGGVRFTAPAGNG
ncbi:C40 family peptidase [Actinomadura violacea]|uniref:C40 family peptidase n=1 Tax=Actinomadura violacea TaxID=2819934 RepID=A0ABS3S9N3_9ACTN|nr:NlpC/P60 family protein [Actinomadura violacea]MBO2464935.1 C40 family peptidase [Actinomadura violacea]